MILLQKVIVIAAATVGFASVADAQVRYQPYPSAPSVYGYPVPGGFLQPDEVLGTSPSYAINPYAGYGQPVVTVTQRCQYPDGWNVTDFHRDLNGIPAGIDHTCPTAGVRARY